MQEMRVRSLGREDPLEEEMATQSSILVWEVQWTEEPGGLQSMGSQTARQDRTWQLNNNKHSLVWWYRRVLIYSPGWTARLFQILARIRKVL